MNAEDESFVNFKNSFNDGPRRDLNFKFLKGLPADEAAAFLQDLLWKLGDTLDDGDASRLIAHIREGQARNYSGAVPRWSYDEGPFTPLSKPVSEARLALLSSSGHFVDGQDPRPFGVKNMSQEEAAERIVTFLRTPPELSEIPLDTPVEKLRVRHPGYDIRGSQADPNVSFPLYQLASLVQEDLIGGLVDPAYSFVGATAQTSLLNEQGPEWVRRIQEQGADGALLVPV